MNRTFAKGTRVHYPYVVEPVQDCWEVLFVDTDRPHRVALLDERTQAVAEADRLNHLWWSSFRESQRLLAQIAGRAAPLPFSTSRASLWKRLKALWPPL